MLSQRRYKRRPEFDPRMLGSTLKVWLDVGGASDSGTLTIPDRMGGAGASQATALVKPALGTTSNGLPKLTNNFNSWLQLPISEGLAEADYFGMAMWLRTSTVAASGGDIFNVSRTSNGGLATFDRISIRRSNDDLTWFNWLPPAPSGNIRNAVTASSRSLLQVNVWKFFSFEYIGVAATEAQRVVFKEGGTPLPLAFATTFSQSAGTATDTPTTLITATGSAVLFNRDTDSPAGFEGDIGPDIFFYDPRSMTSDALVMLAQHRVPIG